MNPKKPRNKCLNCGKECKRPQSIYCCQQCQMDYQYKQYINKWLKGEETGLRGNKYIDLSNYVRRYLLDRAEHKCQECGWKKINSYTNKMPLEIHHIDGDYLNNRPENLKILCPNCHSLTKTYKGRGKGRPFRDK